MHKTTNLCETHFCCNELKKIRVLNTGALNRCVTLFSLYSNYSKSQNCKLASRNPTIVVFQMFQMFVLWAACSKWLKKARGFQWSSPQLFNIPKPPTCGTDFGKHEMN